MGKSWTVLPIAGHEPFVEIHGLDPASLEDAEVRKELNALWTEHGLMVFRGLESPETHIRLSKCFGAFQVHPIQQPDSDPEHLEITNIRATPGGDGGTVYEIDGVQKASWLPLHFDLVYVDKVNRGGSCVRLSCLRPAVERCFLTRSRSTTRCLTI